MAYRVERGNASEARIRLEGVVGAARVEEVRDGFVDELRLERAGRDRASIGIRTTVGDADTRVVDKGQTTQAILAAQPTDTEVASAQTPQ